MNTLHWMLVLSVVFAEVWYGAAQTSDGDICFLQKVTGPCRSQIQRFYYNVEKKECESFWYGGCQGNANNFKTREECNDRCVGPPVDLCSLPPVITTSQTCLASIPSWTYDPAQGKCVPYEYGGCGGTENLFDTEKQCQSSCDPGSLDVCERPPVLPTGPSCLAIIPSWTYDPAQSKCVPYEYGGCGGTENLFDTEKQCQSSCDPGSLDVCERPPVLPTGPSCLASIPSWTYDPAQGKCVPYEYGGCGGTENLFDTEAMCQSACDAITRDVCNQPKITGPCAAFIERFWFNRDTGVCEKFVYGGCGGNDNNFATDQDCGLTCYRKQPRNNKK